MTPAKQLIVRSVLLLVAGALAPTAGVAQDATPMTPEQLEQLASPIALYRDTLISQILMASTYPLEAIEASRWQQANASLQGDALAVALEKQTWDPSVKSLVNFPQVLTMMSERLSWTQQIGNAVLSQQADIMSAIQRLRARAQQAGNLKTTTEQTVVVQETVIVIEPAKPEVIYVPTYNPTVVYGTWPYVAYPPPAPYYPPGYVAGAAIVGFAAGVACSHAWGYAWGGCNWRGGDIDIDINRNVSRNTNINRQKYSAQGRNWQHNPQHRKGVSYPNRTTAERYNRGGNQQRQRASDDHRGRANNNSRTGNSRTGGSKSGGSRGAFGSGNSGKKTKAQSSRGKSSRGRSSGRRSTGGRSSGGGRR